MANKTVLYGSLILTAMDFCRAFLLLSPFFMLFCSVALDVVALNRFFVSKLISLFGEGFFTLCRAIKSDGPQQRNDCLIIMSVFCLLF